MFLAKCKWFEQKFVSSEGNDAREITVKEDELTVKAFVRYITYGTTENFSSSFDNALRAMKLAVFYECQGLMETLSDIFMDNIERQPDVEWTSHELLWNLNTFLVTVEDKAQPEALTPTLVTLKAAVIRILRR